MQLRICNRCVLVRAKNLQRAVLVLRRLRLAGDVAGNRLRIACKLFLARGIAKQAPSRHRPLAGTVDLGVRVEPSLNGQSPGALLVVIGSYLVLLHKQYDTPKSVPNFRCVPCQSQHWDGRVCWQG
jgi:hypothetical protein